MSEMTDDVRRTEAEAKVEEAINRVRPLNATQSRYLLKLVENDFAQLRAEIFEMAEEQKKAKLKEISEGASAEQLKAFGDRAYALQSKFQRERDDLIREAKAQGVTLQIATSMGGVATSDDELQNKIKKVNEDHNAELRTITNILNRKKLEAERKVMIATITTATEDILHAIPDARSLMLEAAQERAQRAADAANKQLTSGVYRPEA